MQDFPDLLSLNCFKTRASWQLHLVHSTGQYKPEPEPKMKYSKKLSQSDC